MLVGQSGRKRGGQARKISGRKKRLHLEQHQTWRLGGWAHGSEAWWQAWARHSRSRTVGGEPRARCTWPPSCPPLEAPAPVTPDLCTELTHILSLLVMTCFPLTLPPCEGDAWGDFCLGRSHPRTLLSACSPGRHLPLSLALTWSHPWGTRG